MSARRWPPGDLGWLLVVLLLLLGCAWAAARVIDTATVRAMLR